MASNRLIAATLLIAAPAFAAGSIRGTVRTSGAIPSAKAPDFKSDAFCAKNGATAEEPIVVKYGKLANAVVRILDGAAQVTPPEAPINVDQTGCVYKPRIQGAVLGQKVQVKNGDATLHNVHGFAGPKTLFNQAQPPKSAPLNKAIATGDVLKLKCDVHSWMTAFVVFSKGPFGVSAPDGTFEIKDLPAGKYKIEAWHEKLGAKTMEIIVEDGKTATADFEFAAQLAAN